MEYSPLTKIREILLFLNSLRIFMDEETKTENKTPKQRLISAWTGAVSGVVFWIVMGFFFNWVWWVIFLIAMTLLTPINATIKYLGGEDTKKCLNCGTRIDKNAQFCTHCGAQCLIVCPGCNQKITGDGRFCNGCGKDMIALVNEIEKKPQPSAPLKPAATGVGSIQKTNFCPACGTSIPEGVHICPTCGEKL
jgi:predicted nucleic acid-binding Zn ribbon protein